ncbi:hypothetical protein BCY86_06340 [Pajaroellobacter abortibovis]|uniref:Mandelate racemase/muconate lactonizing enzyme C-terminal domain-containing protein n=1 Tax=Pajaroellobacter abortibovis TaxID=1882918 RepID=A0A1L6MZK2_9BACT|nr:hypothetical protein BCY86_06340 [Pajaroellobacter abortibovis]
MNAWIATLGISPQREPSALFALETALLDLVGQARGESIAFVLGGGGYDKVELSGVLDLAEPLELWEQNKEWLDNQGIRTLKVKVGHQCLSLERELERLEERLCQMRGQRTLRLDANGAWSPAEAILRLSSYSRFCPQFVEEPTKGLGLMELGPCSVPWAADESLVDPSLQPLLLQDGNCSVWVLKPALVGGLLMARALAEKAHQFGVEVVVTHCVDGPVALTAASQLALSLNRPPLACGLAKHKRLGIWKEREIAGFQQPGWITHTHRPGLGWSVEEKEAFLNHMVRLA